MSIYVSNEWIGWKLEEKLSPHSILKITKYVTALMIVESIHCMDI